MADNVQAEAVVTPGSTFATDDDGTAHHPYVKLEWGADNTFTKVASGAGALPIQDGGNSITVDGTVTANAGSGTMAVSAASLPLPTGAATAAGQTQPGVDIGDVTVNNSSGAGAVNVQDGGNSLTVDGSISITEGGNTATVGANGRLRVETAAKTSDDEAFTPGTSDGYPIFGFANDTTPDSVDEGDTGAVRMSLNRNLYIQLRDLSAERSAAVTAGNALKVDGSGVTQPVSGTVTANAGTNLNTSALALESGGNLAAVKTAVEIMDDWDESDRAKVNLIAGQAGVAGGSGVVSATTQRVVIADHNGKTIKKGVVSLSASGNIVAAVTSKSIRVFAFAAQSRNDSMTLQVTNGSGGSALSLRWAFNTREGVSRAVSIPSNIMATSDNTALYATITGTGTIDIEVSYWDDDAA